MESVSNDVSGIDSEEIENYLFSLSEESQREEFVTASYSRVKSGESEERMRAEESLNRELTPNLRDMVREERVKDEINEVKSKILNVGSGVETYSLIEALFELNMKLFKIQIPLLVSQDFANETNQLIAKISHSSEEIDAELKYEPSYTYCMLLLCANELASLAAFSALPYGNHYLKLYNLEVETECKILGTELLVLQILAHQSVVGIFLKPLLELSKDPKKNDSQEMESLVTTTSLKAKKFAEEAVFPGTQQILHALRERGNPEALTKFILSYVLFFHFSKISLATMGSSFPNSERDPLIAFLPFVVEHASLDKIGLYFNERFESLPEWERAYKWIDLHCQAAEILINNPKRALAFLDRAKNEVKNTLWTTFFTSNKSMWDEKYKMAMARIAQIRSQIEEL
ncbi:MAG: hypothetical protein K1060chlam2_01496 [Chlamydiae bacterium]|nr:hypothetical protein [Chlamydiota bacterium]